MHKGHKVKFWSDIFNNHQKVLVKRNTEAIVINNKPLSLVDVITIGNGNKIILNVPSEYLDLIDMDTNIIDLEKVRD